MANQDKYLTVAVETHGCKLNQADSLILSREFQVAGLLWAYLEYYTSAQ